jgi:homocitrate synthase NifV
VRADPRQLAAVLDRVSELGAVSAVICDTVGVMTPRTIADYIQTLRAVMKRPLDLGIHCHNDYGLGTANTLAAVDVGCTLVTSTVNGLGERAGNAVFEEVVCALADLYRVDVRIDKAVLQRLADTVARASGIFIVPTKPVVGYNVFRHESGVHVDGMLKDASTYESIDPGPLGRAHELLLGKHSGSGLVEARLAAKGIVSTPELAHRIVERVKLAKVSTNKGPMRAMAERLTEMWSRYLAFPDEDFWTIVYDEMARSQARPQATTTVLPIAAGPAAPVPTTSTRAPASKPAALPEATPRAKPAPLAQGTRPLPRISRSRNRATL